ncbi:MAG: S9 family peptidase, partial [Terricaulis sp.]
MPIPEAPPLITRAALFGEPARHGGQLSPRGDRVAFLAPRDGVTNLWVLSVDAMDEARPVTDERERGITNFRWAADGATLLYL